MTIKYVVFWTCTKCRKSGEFTFSANTPIHRVYAIINDNHYNDNRYCTFSWDRLKLCIKRIDI